MFSSSAGAVEPLRAVSGGFRRPETVAVASLVRFFGEMRPVFTGEAFASDAWRLCLGCLHPVKNPLTLPTRCTFPGPFLSRRRPGTRSRLWTLCSWVQLRGNLGGRRRRDVPPAANVKFQRTNGDAGASRTCCFCLFANDEVFITR